MFRSGLITLLTTPAAHKRGLASPAHPTLGSATTENTHSLQTPAATPAALVFFFLITAAATSAAEKISFSREILPILSDTCFACHGPDAGSRKGGLRLDTREGACGQSDSGAPAIVPGHSADSEMIRRLLSSDLDEKMPPPKANHQLSHEQISLLRRWIDEGAPWGRHWAFEPPQLPAVPTTSPESSHPIDAFIHHRLEKTNLHPSAEAPRATLIRRLSLDLTGIPPSPEETAAFLHDTTPEAYDRVVDRLLASPHYGERMAWDWLEAARYADSNGYQGDSERTMWPWRDWVVRAYNQNLPYDQFTVWQIAGDLLPNPSHDQQLATGFLRNHMINGEGGRIAEENRIEYLFDQTETVATVWLGATFNCTRCHDHKFDPYTQRDYFGLLAFFNQTAVDGSGGNPQSPPVLAAPAPDQTERIETLTTSVATLAAAVETSERTLYPRETGIAIEHSAIAGTLPPDVLTALKVAARDRDPGQLEKLATHWHGRDDTYTRLLNNQKQARQDLDATLRTIPQVMIMQDLPSRRPTFILKRGDYLQPAGEVDMLLPASLTTTPTPPRADRLGLAQWLVSRDNPLTARVAVNRLWQMVFGTGLVKTPEDFGVQAKLPSHPELLDWLAIRLMESGWDVKHLLRLIVTSQTYRQSSRATPEMVEQDPENSLLARGPRYRMASWMIRDSALATANLLTRQVGGSPVRPYQPPGVWEEATFGNKRYEQDHGPALYRRSLYVFWRRIVAPTLFFDVANRQSCSVKTARTNVPLHALLTLNDTTYIEAARALAQSLLLTETTEPTERLARAFQQVLSRAPGPEEQLILQRALAQHRADFQTHPEAATALLATGESPRHPDLDPVEHAAWTVVCNTLLNLDEALTRE
jgi:hypothetical protein